ncbi:MAG: hypothetical protein LLG42_16450 [Chloroflexi bacterium]|nr:hypothetical protein [Chloroflexota bacterium]
MPPPICAILLRDAFHLPLSGLGGKGVSHLRHFPGRILMLKGLAYDVCDGSGGNAQSGHLADRQKGLNREFAPLFAVDLAAMLLEGFRSLSFFTIAPAHYGFKDATKTEQPPPLTTIKNMESLCHRFSVGANVVLVEENAKEEKTTKELFPNSLGICWRIRRNGSVARFTEPKGRERDFLPPQHPDG